MFRRMVSRMGLSAIAGLGLLLVVGQAKADQQGWPVAGSWGYYGGSSRSSSGSYSPSYYSTYQPRGYYGYASPQNYYRSSTTEGYYGATGTGDYYGTSTAESPRKRSVRVNVRVPSDAKIWFDGSQTSQTGTTRSFESPPLAAGPEYV